VEPRPSARFAWLAGASLGLGVLLGAMLRGLFAGVPLPFGRFVELRHAHSHLGYYGVLIPLVWWAWAQGGPRPPGPLTTAVYGGAVLVATVGFAREGYGFTAIVASTVVLAIWLGSAWRAAPQLLALRSWWGPATPSIVGSAVAIPLVAVYFQRDPALASELVQLFLTLLLFGLVVPAALAHRGAPAPLSPLWLAGTVGAALALGPWPRLPALALTALLGAQILWAGGRSASPWDLRALWGLLGLGLMAFGLGQVDESHALAVAGLHLAILGPVLVSLGRPISPRGPRWICLAYEVAVLALTAAVALPQWLPWAGWPQVAAVAGLLIAASWILAVVVRGWRGA
jgi:hypothetical protein